MKQESVRRDVDATHGQRSQQARVPHSVAIRANAMIAMIVAGTLMLSACAGRGAVEQSADTNGAGTTVERIAIVAPEKESDHGWNQQGLRAAKSVASELGIELDAHPNVGYDNTETILTQVADSGADLLIAHASGFNAAGHRVGSQTGVPTLVVDFEQNVPGKVATAIPEPQEGAYLAGVAAALKTQTRVVGVVASAENLNWFLMAGGFAQGVYSVDPEIEIVMAYIGPANYGDSAGGTAVANQVIAQGADVIMGMGDGATVGYLQAIETAQVDYPISYIATIGDVSEIVDRSETVLTSVIWDFTDTYKRAISDIESGTFGTETYRLNVENGGLALLQTPQLTEAILAEIDRATEAIIAGTVDVKRSEDKAAVQSMIDSRAS